MVVLLVGLLLLLELEVLLLELLELLVGVAVSAGCAELILGGMRGCRIFFDFFHFGCLLLFRRSLLAPSEEPTNVHDHKEISAWHATSMTQRLRAITGPVTGGLSLAMTRLH